MKSYTNLASHYVPINQYIIFPIKEEVQALIIEHILTMSFSRVLFLIYCGVCTLAGILLFIDYYLPKHTALAKVEEVWSESSRTSRSSFSSNPQNYFMVLDGKKVSVDQTTYATSEIGDTLAVVKTKVLNRISGIKLLTESGHIREVFSSYYNLFPLIPILLMLPIINFFVGKRRFLREFLIPFSLLVPIVIFLFNL
ncbi:MAG: hypothetical protein ACO1OQ_07135 [Rufibacter sp.]